MSKPSWFAWFGVFAPTGAPNALMVLLNTLFTGFAASASDVVSAPDCICTWSPVSPRSPS